MTREGAIDIVKCLAWHDLRPSEEDIEQAIKTLKQEPRKGKWIGKGYFITCSCCNEMSYPCDSGGYGSIYHDYCPNCGADMREVKE